MYVHTLKKQHINMIILNKINFICKNCGTLKIIQYFCDPQNVTWSSKLNNRVIHR